MAVICIFFITEIFTLTSLENLLVPEIPTVGIISECGGVTNSFLENIVSFFLYDNFSK